jgi:hypothetical protein
MGSMKVWDGTAWQTASAQGPAGTAGNVWERYINVTGINLTSTFGSFVYATIVTINAGAAGTLIVDFICQLTCVSPGGAQTVQLSCAQSSPVATIAPETVARGSFVTNDRLALPLNASWEGVTAGQVVVVKAALAAGGSGGFTLNSCAGSYRIVPP